MIDRNILLSLIILILMMVSFVLEAVPVYVTAMAAGILFGIVGIIPFETVFSGFSNDTIIMIAGAMIVGSSMAETGAARYLGQRIVGLTGYNERKVLASFMVLGALLSCFISNTAVMAMMLPLIHSVAVGSGGKIKAKHLALPVGMAVLTGGSCTLIGSAPQLMSQGQLLDGGFRPFSMFELGICGLPSLVIIVLYFTTAGYSAIVRLTAAIPDPDIPPADPEQTLSITPKMCICLGVMLWMVVCFFLKIWTNGAIAALAGLICIATRCIPAKQALKRIDWNSIVVIASGFGVGKALSESGTTNFLADGIMRFLGETPNIFLLLAMVGLLCTALANIMSHTVLLTILVPLFIPIAQKLNLDVSTLVFALTCYVCVGYMTPLGGASYSMLLQEGYRFTDFVKLGVVPNVLCYLVVLLVSYGRILLKI